MAERILDGKIAVITGAGRGIGKSIALAFASAGADIAICARNGAEVDDTRKDIAKLGQHCLAQAVDVADPDQVERFARAIMAEFNAIDVLVNNAVAYLERGTFIDSDPALWWRTMEVNLRGPYLMTRHLVEAMRPGAKVINLTSGKDYSAGANSSAYHVSKAALNMLTEGLANEFWQREIEVNSLVPGPTATATFDNASSGEERSAEAILAGGRDALPKGLPPWERVKHPDEVAELALQMASYPAGGPTGQVFSLARRPM